MGLAKALSELVLLEPASWLALSQAAPRWAGLSAAALGAVLLAFGSGPAFRIIAGPLGAVAAASVAAPVARHLFGFPHPPAPLPLLAAAAGAAAGVVLPPAAVFLAVGGATGLIAAAIAGPTDWALGFVPGFVAGGVIGAAFHRGVGAVASSLVGGWLLTLGALAALGPAGKVVEVVSRWPWALASVALFFGVSGATYHLALAPSPEEREKRRAEAAEGRRREAERKALERRWARYLGEDDDRG